MIDKAVGIAAVVSSWDVSGTDAILREDQTALSYMRCVFPHKGNDTEDLSSKE